MTDEFQIVVLCAEEDDLAPNLVRVVHEIVTRKIATEVLLLDERLFASEIVTSRPRAAFLLLVSPNLGARRVDALRASFDVHRRAGQELLIHRLASDVARIVASLDEAIARSRTPVPISMKRRRLLVMTASAIDDALSRLPRRPHDFQVD